jgi:hypothetical protein
MFGHHKAIQSKSALGKIKNRVEGEEEKIKEKPATTAPEPMSNETLNEEAEKRAGKSKENRKINRAEGRQETEEFFRGNHEGLGLDPKVRQAMQFEANKAIQRGHQSANRKLLGEQSQRGVGGQGGVGYAQQRDLMQLANDSRAGVDRDLTKLDKDLELKKLAAIFTGGEGYAAQSQLDRQLALDELGLEEEKKRNRYWEEKFNETLNRI